MNNNYDTVLFDLDGTLIKTSPGVISCLIKTLTDMSLPVPPKDRLHLFLGPPLHYCFTSVCGLDDATASKAAVIYHKYYIAGGIYDAQVYDGIPELLSTLSESGLRLGVATLKAEAQAKDVLRHFGLLRYFSVVSGSPADIRTWTKKDSILAALSTLGAGKSGCVMIGDRRYDAEGAADAGIDCIGVRYGYGTIEELSSCGFGKFAETPGDIGGILLGRAVVL